MKRVIRHPAVVVILAAALAAVPLSGCAGKAAAEWKTPADEAELAKLEAATLQKGLSRDRRAQLFFLWGQELSEKDPNRAIGAFERVVDLGSILVDESRFNLEILWRQKEQQSQNQQDQQNQNDQKDQKNSQGQSGKNGDQNRKDSKDQQDQSGQNGQQNQKDQRGQNGQSSKADQSKDGQQRPAQSDADKAKPKDLSALVCDKEQSSDLDKALKAELERRNEQQTTQAGGVAPVEKDW